MSKRAKIIAVSTMSSGFIVLALFLAHATQPRVLALDTTPDGTALCVVQECNWSPCEWFTTYFVYQKPGGKWLSYYFDHEAGYWGHMDVTLDTNAHTAFFHRGSKPTITFDWLTENYTSHRTSWTLPDGTRTNGWKDTNAPSPMPARWSPPFQYFLEKNAVKPDHSP